VKESSGTAPPYRRDESRRLALWLVLVAALIALGYGSRIGAKTDPEVLYRWSTALGGLVQDAIVLALVLWIAGARRDLLALRRPVSIRRALGLVVLAIVGIYVFEGIYTTLFHPGNEQGLTPKHWEAAHASAYVVNGLVICLWVPLVEELTYRGLGYSLLERLGRWPAILLVGLLFGLSHGLLTSLPVLVVFGCTLAWIRSRTRSVYPGMVVHALFNLVALVVAVVV
jgi:uncharacterized protein